MSLVQSLRSLAAPIRPRKGEATRAAIVAAAMAVARREGLEGLTIGLLADQLQMSKSGVFAHFGAREELQLAVLNEYAAQFVDAVLKPAIAAGRGMPRLWALLDNWLAALGRELEQGCLMIAGASEYDDREGSLHDAMVRIVTGWKAELLRAIAAAADAGHLARAAEAEQLVFEIYGLMLVAHHDARLLRSRNSLARARTGLRRLLGAFASPAGQRVLAAASRPAAVKSGRPAAGRAGAASKPARAVGARASPLRPGRAPGRHKPDRLTETQRVHGRAKGSRTRAPKE